MSSTSVHFASESNEWATPQYLFDELNAEFNFTIDTAATADNAKCKRYFTEADNGLLQSWQGERVWCNPPYGGQIGKWIEKAAIAGADLAVLLIPARTDTAAWHEYIFGRAEIRFIRGRLKFNDHVNSAPFPSAIVIFRGNYDAPHQQYLTFGLAV